jgi:alginate O-acetyltransferase complex protein AlgI
VLVLLLIVFKLYQEFTVPWLGGAYLRSEVLMVVGFSYFIFRAINVLRIQTLLKLDERSPWKMLCYTLFPPTLASGPIQKYQDFTAQMSNPAPLTRALLYEAGYRLSRGYFRKIVLAAVTDTCIQHLLADQLTPLTSTLVTVLFYLYLYFDFAGYSDLAIGFGLLLGIRVPENFKKPFLATTISEFWRNWHITLVDWFRDNIYIPMGGMKGPRWRAGLLALLIMFLCGLWHGVNVPFAVWGIWYGGWMALEAISGTAPLPPALRHGARYWGRVLWTNARVALACLLFLPGSDTMFRVFRGFANWKWL